MSITDLISAAMNKDASAFESTFANVMQAKVSAALEARFAPQVANEEYELEEAKDDEDEEDDKSEDDDEDEEDDEDMKEEVENLDEISQQKLGSYYDAAAKDRKKAKAEVEKGMAQKKFTPASVQKTSDAYKRFVKRGKGMTAAANKMDEETSGAK